MDAVNVATVIVALIAALGAWASQRAASKSATRNVTVASRVDMEKEAYDRARAYDTETISRQDNEIKELRLEHESCEEKIEKLRAKYESEIDILRLRIARLEGVMHTRLEELLRERLDEPDDDAPV